MKPGIIGALCCLSFGTSNLLSAQPQTDVEIWVNADALNPEIESSEFLESLGSTTLKQEGLFISTQGGRGQPTQFFLDGSDSGDLLVLVDGFRLTDSGAPARSFDFNLLESDSSGVRAIRANSELLSLGSSGVFGAVEFVTKVPDAEPKMSWKQIAGGNKTFSETLTFEGGSRKTRNLIRVSRYDSEEISAADEDAGNKEKDPHRYTSLLIKNYQLPAERLQMMFGLSGKISQTALDGSGINGLPVEDENFELERTALRAFSRVKLESSEKWHHTLRLQAFQNKREYTDEVTASDPVDLGGFKFEGQTFDGGLENSVDLTESHRLSFGANYVFERMEREGFDRFKSRAFEWNPYLRNNWQLGRDFSLGLGASGVLASGFAGGSVFRGDAKYTARSIRTDFELGGGSGIKSPSLFQRFDPLYGEAGLKPQKDLTARLKVSHYFPADFGTLSIEPYWKKSTEVIIFDFANQRYLNQSENEFFGGSLALDLTPDRNTLWNNRVSILSKSFERRSRHQWKQSISRTWFLQKLKTEVAFQWVGSRPDFDGSVLSPYRLFDFHAAYKISSSVEVMASLLNVTNEDYEISKGYGVYGRTFYAGFEATL